ncbi:thioesterase [Nocardioidaceae bacterium]|nr:thioesterase [Nocardioidaceae bacterium]
MSDDAAGTRTTRRFEVTAEDTAAAVGSGTVAVLGTPRVVAWCEAATVALAEQVGLAPGRTTVGTRVEVDHLRPSPVGEQVVVTATLASHEGRRWEFEVEATHGDGTVVARALVRRAEVDEAGFGS